MSARVWSRNVRGGDVVVALVTGLPYAFVASVAISTAPSALAILLWTVPLILAVIPARMAEAKGRSFGTWWFFGLLLIVALPAALLLRRDPDDPATMRYSLWAVPVGLALLVPALVLLGGAYGAAWDYEGSPAKRCEAGDEFSCWHPALAGLEGAAAAIGGPALAIGALVQHAEHRLRRPRRRTAQNAPRAISPAS